MGLYTKLHKIYDSFDHEIDVEFPTDSIMVLNTKLRVVKGANNYTLSYSSATNIKNKTVSDINDKIKELKLKHIQNVLDDLVGEYQKEIQENVGNVKNNNKNDNIKSSEGSDKESREDMSPEDLDLTEEQTESWGPETIRAYSEYIERLKKIKNKLNIGDDKLVEYAKGYDEEIEKRKDIVPKNIIEVVNYIEREYIDSERDG